MRIIPFFLALMAFTVVSCRQGGSAEDGQIPTSSVQNSQSATGDEGSEGLPSIAFEKMEHDFGHILEGESVEYSFHFTNRGDAPLVINACYGSCGCTVPEWPREPLGPGQEGAIKVVFNSLHHPNKNTKTISVVANTEPRLTVLKIHADVEPENTSNN